MLQENYQSKETKFSLWARRMVWGILSAEQAIDQAMYTKKDDTAITAEGLATEAKSKIVAPAESTNEDNKKVETAKARVDSLQAKLAEKVAQIEARAALKARLVAVNPKADFLHAVDEMEAIKKENAKLPDTLKVELTRQDKEVSDAAQAYYDGLKNVQWFSEGAVTADTGVVGQNESQDKPIVDFRKVLADVSAMQQALVAGFKGLGERGSLEADYKARIEAGMKWLQGKKEETWTQDNGIFNIANDVDKAALDRLDFAMKNLEAARKSGEKGHEAGARQYMTMVLAEQEARRVHANLSQVNYGIYDIVSDEESWKDQYNLAVQAYNEGAALTARSNDPKYAEATAKFKEAARLFREVKVEQEKGKKSAESDLTTQVNKFNALSEKRKQLIEELQAEGIAGIGEVKKEIEKRQGLSTEGIKDSNIVSEIVSEAVEGLTELNSQLEKYLKEARDLKKNILPGRMMAALGHIESEYERGNDKVNLQQVVNDFVGFYTFGGTDFQKLVLVAAEGMVLSGRCKVRLRNGNNREWLLTAVKNVGKWTVKVEDLGPRTKEYAVEKRSTVITRQEALEFAKRKALGGFFDKNQDKVEAIEDYILDMSEWRDRLGSALEARATYLEMLKGESFDVPNSNFHVEIRGGKVKVTDKTAVKPSDSGSGESGAGGAGGSAGAGGSSGEGNS